MARKDIYIKAFDSLLNSELSKEDLWDLLNEHFGMLDERNEGLQKSLDQYRNKYNHLLNQVNEVHEEHERIYKNL